MPVDEDKYPMESGRRRFVKGVVGSAALASVGAGGAAALDTATGPLGSGGGRTEFIGIELLDGPAPRGMPIVPLEITGDNELRGVPPTTEEELSDQQSQEGFGGSGLPYTYSWFQYCGVQSYAGLDPSVDHDNMIRATIGSSGPDYEWMGDIEDGTPLSVDMFEDYEEWGNGIGRSGLGKPAIARWRSEQPEATTMPVQVIRSPIVEQMAAGEGEYSELTDDVQSFIQEATQDGFIAWLDKCTHFCCVPKFKQYADSAQFGGEDAVYCQCHQSVYDPFSPVRLDFVALPRPD